MTTALMLLRHGLTDMNRRGIFQGQWDEPLNSTGVEQAKAAAPGVAAHRPAAIYSSDLSRAANTGLEVAQYTGLELKTDPRLREIDCGTWSGRPVSEIMAEFPEYLAMSKEGKDFRRSATGETESEVAGRVTPVLNQLFERHEGQTVVVVCHGLAIRVSIARMLGWPDEFRACLGTMANCHYAMLTRSGQRTRLAAYNVGW